MWRPRGGVGSRHVADALFHCLGRLATVVATLAFGRAGRSCSENMAKKGFPAAHEPACTRMSSAIVLVKYSTSSCDPDSKVDRIRALRKRSRTYATIAHARGLRGHGCHQVSKCCGGLNPAIKSVEGGGSPPDDERGGFGVAASQESGTRPPYFPHGSLVVQTAFTRWCAKRATVLGRSRPVRSALTGVCKIKAAGP